MSRIIRSLPLSVLLAFSKTSVFACAVCFGSPGGSWSRGFTWGVAFLAVLPFLMLAGFAWRIAVAIRKKASN